MATIRGKNYILQANTQCSYTLTGSNRNATFNIGNQDKVISAFVLANDVIISPVKGFLNYENLCTIKRARLVPSGAYGARPSPVSVAGRLNIAVVAGIDGKKLDNTDGDTLAVFALYFENWDEWTEFNINVEPFKTKINWEEYQHDADKKPCSFKILEHAQFFSIDDFNIQSAYIGQNVYPMIDFEIDTAGIVLQNGAIV